MGIGLSSSQVLAEESGNASASAEADASEEEAASSSEEERQQHDEEGSLPTEPEAESVESDSAVQPTLSQERLQAPISATKGSALPESKQLIGAVAFVMENQSQLTFRARVDTGAQSCSIHTEEVLIEDPEESMEDNVGKSVRIKLKNQNEESEWVETRISQLVRVKTSERAEQRYCVSLILVYKDFEKKVRVTLNDRSHMVHPLLLGRNFLQGDFLVDVEFPVPE